SLAFRAIAAHAMGDVAAARADFAAATGLDLSIHEGRAIESLYPLASQQVRHHLDVGDLAAARTLAERGLTTARSIGSNIDTPRLAALLARIDLATGADPTSHLDAIRAW